MTSSNGPDLDELLALVNQPGPLPGDTEERLLRELHASLDQGPLTTDTRAPGVDEALADTDAEVITLSPFDQTETASSGVSRAGWIAAAAAGVIALALGAALLADDPETRVANQPTPPPVLTDMSDACTRFSDTTPDRTDLTELVATTDPSAAAELARTIDALEILQRDLDAGAELSADELASLQLTLGFLRQAALELDNIQPAGDALDQAHELLRGLGDTHPAFRACRNY